MKKLLLSATFALLSASITAQSYYVCSSDGTFMEVPLCYNTELNLENAQAELPQINFLNITSDGQFYVKNFFALPCVDSITTAKPLTGKEIKIVDNSDITFDASDESAYDEIVETIITDELVDESGDFVENFAYESLVTITFSESGVTTMPATVSGVTFEKNGAHLIVNSTKGKMRYIVKGKSSDASLKIYSTKKFELMLGGLTLTNPTGPAINIQSGKSVYFTIGTGTTNTLCDGATYSAPVVTNGEEEDQKGTIFSEGQLLINGNGTLNVTSLGGHGICSDDYIRIRSGKINVESLKDGFHTNDLFRVGRTEKYSPIINVTSGGDAIDCGKGYVLIEAGKLLLSSEGEGIKASYNEAVPDTTIIPDITIAGGYVKIATTGIKSSAIKATGNYTHTGGIVQAQVSGDGSKVVNIDRNITFSGGKLTGISTGTVALTDTTAAGGIKCVGDLSIIDGEIAIKCTGEGSKAVNCDATMVVEGGSARLLAEGDDYYDINGYKRAQGVNCINFIMSGGTLVVNSAINSFTADQAEMSGGVMQLMNVSNANPDDFPLELLHTGGCLSFIYKVPILVKIFLNNSGTV